MHGSSLCLRSLYWDGTKNDAKGLEEDVVRSARGLVFPYGSFALGVSSVASDIDL